MVTSSTEQNLLLGMLALQLDFISRDDLLQAMQTWVLHKSRSLGSILLEQDRLSENRQALLESIVQEYLKLHQNDPHASLAAIGLLDSIQEELQALGDAEVEDTLLRVPAEPAETLEMQGPSSGELPGGRYRVLCPHAQGGLGKVSIAVDQELHREVAFKELRDRTADDPSCRARFILEAEVTGSLEHPGVVPVYGLGHHANGRPFYAMQFIRGESLQEAIAQFHAVSRATPGQRALQLRGLLRRFLDVCNSIQYAHSRGVLHRDLKPSNVMLGKYGETLVVDWGLAKAMGRVDAERTDNEETFHPAEGSGAETLTGSPIGTPAYMSPEQREGRLDDLGPTSDVYSLGATLYSLLTGRAPQTETVAKPAEGSPVAQARRFPVRGEAGTIEGQLVRPRTLKTQVPACLEAICLKALADQSHDRYATAKELAEDIEHWLADERTTAYEESCSERLARWTRHHRSWTQAGAAALILVAVVSSVATVFVNQAREAERVAKLQAQDAKRKAVEHKLVAVRNFGLARDAVDTWMTGAAQDLGYVTGGQQLRMGLLKKAARAYESFAQELDGDVDLEIERGRTLLRLGDVHRMLTDFNLAEEEYESAEAVFAQIVREHPDLVEGRIALANSRIKLGLLQQRIEDSASAKKTLADAIESLRQMTARYPNDTRVHDSLGTALVNQSMLLHEAGQLGRAESDGLEAVTEFTKALLKNRGEPRYERGLSQARQQLATILLEFGRYDEAESLFRTVVATLSNLSNEDERLANVESLAAAKISLASLLRIQGRVQEALDVYRTASQDFQALCDKLPEERRYRENLAITQNNLGQLLHRMGHTDEAEAELKAAFDIFTGLATFYPNLGRQAACRDTWGQLLSDRGQNEEAQRAFEESLLIIQKLIQEHPDVPLYREQSAVLLSHYGQLLHKRGDDEAAEAFRLAAEALDGLIQSVPGAASHYWDELGFVNAHLGEFRADTDDLEGSKTAFNRAQECWEEIAGTRAPATEHLHNYAWFLVSCSNPEVRDSSKARDLAQKARDESPKNADYCSTLGAAHYRAQNWQQAIQLLREAISLRGYSHARDLSFLAMAQWQQGDREESQRSYQQAVEWMESNLPGNLELRRIRAEVKQLLSND